MTNDPIADEPHEQPDPSDVHDGPGNGVVLEENIDGVEACVGDWIVYYEPQRVVPDPAAPGMYLALIEPASSPRYRRSLSTCRERIGQPAVFILIDGSIRRLSRRSPDRPRIG